MSYVARDWMAHGACTGTDPVLFSGLEGETEAERVIREAQAKAICARCPVRAPCLGYALIFPSQHGIWGGTGEEERRVLRYNRARRQRVREKRAAA